MFDKVDAILERYVFLCFNYLLHISVVKKMKLHSRDSTKMSCIPSPNTRCPKWKCDVLCISYAYRCRSTENTFVSRSSLYMTTTRS